jgi:hypothetical protein
MSTRPAVISSKRKFDAGVEAAMSICWLRSHGSMRNVSGTVVTSPTRPIANFFQKKKGSNIDSIGLRAPS